MSWKVCLIIAWERWGSGRNIHALDPYRMPSAGALERGTAAAEAIISQHRAANEDKWPETVAVSAAPAAADAVPVPDLSLIWALTASCLWKAAVRIDLSYCG